MAASDLIGLFQKKKRLRVEPILLKYHSRLLFMVTMAIVVFLYAKDQQNGLVSCSVRGGDTNVQELNQHCVNGRLFYRSRHNEYLKHIKKGNWNAKSKDFW